jgi:isochorismate synthase
MIVLPSRIRDNVPMDLAETACREATRRRSAVLMARTLDIEPIAALGLYARAVRAGHDAVYWEQPSRDCLMVAAGASRLAELRGEGRFRSAAATWSALVEGAVANRLDDLAAFAGFSFAAGTPRAAHWAPLGDGLLMVPTLLYRAGDGRATVTFTTMVPPGAAPGDLAPRLASLLEEGSGSREDREERIVERPTLRDEVAAAPWSDGVREITRAIESGRVSKVVLAREVQLRADGRIEETAALDRLRGAYPDCTIFSFRRGDACFLGATPECLVRVDGPAVYATCLAGSARRGVNPADDAALGAALLADEKERREHRLVVDTIRVSLAPLCETLDIAASPALMRMPNVQHLYTPVRGTLAAGASLLQLVARMHPTPAVGGIPRAAALGLIRAIEGFDRGWYAGPVGWIGTRGDGEFAVGLRSGLLTGAEARLFAGCGIVAGSDPQREYEESMLKLRPMLCALQV